MPIDFQNLVSLFNDACEKIYAYRNGYHYTHTGRTRKPNQPIGFLNMPKANQILKPKHAFIVYNGHVTLRERDLSAHERIEKQILYQDIIALGPRMREALCASSVFDRPDFWGRLDVYPPGKSPRMMLRLQTHPIADNPLVARNLTKRLELRVKRIEEVRARISLKRDRLADQPA